MKLRDYQDRAVGEVREHFRRGNRRVVLIAPTGAGKTVMFSHVAAATAARGKRVVVIAHRKELVDQTHAKLAEYDVEAGVIMGADSRADDYLPVQVCSIQTLARRKHRLPPADLIIYDEVHHALSQSSRDVLACYPGAFVLGATATPWRTDKLGLADIFDAHVVAASMCELIAQGSLVAYDCFAYDSPNLHEVKTTAGDFNQRDLALACNTSVLVGSVVREYHQHAPGRPCIVFPVDIAHSRALVLEFRSAGYAAEHLDCDTPKEERERIIGGFRSGAVTVLSSVGVLTEGFDAPRAEVCVLARPTKSLSLYLQMAGRVLRPFRDKRRALIHDHGGNLLRHGLPDDERDMSLTATPQRVRDLLTCPLCSAVMASIRKDGTCPKCGELIAPPGETEPDALKKPRQEKELVEGTRISRETIEAIRGKLGKGASRAHLSDADLVRVAKATRAEKAAEFLRLREVCRAKGFQPGWVSHAYRGTFGTWPRFDDDALAGVQPARAPFLPLPPRQS